MSDYLEDLKAEAEEAEALRKENAELKRDWCGRWMTGDECWRNPPCTVHSALAALKALSEERHQAAHRFLDRAEKAEARVAELKRLVAVALDRIGRARHEWEDGSDEGIATALDEARDEILDWKDAKKEAPRR